MQHYDLNPASHKPGAVQVVSCISMLACEPLIGPLLSSGYGYCTDLGVGPFGMTAMMRRATIAQRTSGGARCRLPLVVDDRLLTDCVKDAGGREQCYVGELGAGLSACDAAPAGPPLFLPNMLAASQVRPAAAAILPVSLLVRGTAPCRPGGCRAGPATSHAAAAPARQAGRNAGAPGPYASLLCCICTAIPVREVGMRFEVLGAALTEPPTNLNLPGVLCGAWFGKPCCRNRQAAGARGRSPCARAWWRATSYGNLWKPYMLP